MAGRGTQDPSESPSGFDGRSYNHPAFGQISVARVSGKISLYGSDFVHHSYVVVRIARSKLDRSLSRDTHFPDTTPIVEIAMSESQWATFVSSFNQGSGPPCTIQQVEGSIIPAIPHRDSRDEYQREAIEGLEASVAALLRTRKIVAESVSGMSKRRQDEALAGIDSAIQELRDNFPYIMDTVSKFMEKRVEKAKVEVNTYVNNAIHRAGIAALSEGAPPPLMLPLGTESDSDN